eukprot:CAMPEP_0206134546 /NCGR_PEP_ID=MMETSP1473-20131121/70_1 /ASSEMBLY_ACC=CAM_ASM_001109 /TAXON_ID=1461547 /ORGANISM="Stichococcus sp, Strain RCC1054" /LENGTH=117 /DNA_ID=CAMNT_0053526161 /DNA_START=866 /DNA_END=1220 /DNA_ORIENTATION=-
MHDVNDVVIGAMHDEDAALDQRHKACVHENIRAGRPPLPARVQHPQADISGLWSTRPANLGLLAAKSTLGPEPTLWPYSTMSDGCSLKRSSRQSTTVSRSITDAATDGSPVLQPYPV